MKASDLPEPTADNFMGVEFAGVYGRIRNKLVNTPVRVKSYSGPQNAAEFIAGFIGVANSDAKVIMRQADGSSVCVRMLEEGRPTPYVRKLVTSLMTEKQRDLVALMSEGKS